MRVLMLAVCFLGTPLMADAPSHLNLIHVFRTAPVIYALLLGLSLCSFTIWLYSIITLRIHNLIPTDFLSTIRHLLLKKQYDEALQLCQHADHFTAGILASGLSSRGYGYQVVLETMQTEGKRCGVTLWQRLSLINEVVIISPMLGLLGTVLGLFYAFYDVNHSPDTLASIFDGLGIAIGTTVAGLIVSIMAMIFYATLKFRVIRLLNVLENETIAIGHLIEAK